MRTLHDHLTEFFTTLKRPVLADAFAEDYAALHPNLAAKLARAHEEPISMQAVANLLGMLPLGRAVTVTELETPDGDPRADGRPVLTDHALSWLRYARESPGALVAALLARLVLHERPSDDLQSAQARLHRALTDDALAWNFDWGGLARAARLLAAEQEAPTIVASTLAQAALLIMARPAWVAITQAFPVTTGEWQCLERAYVEARSRLISAHPLYPDRLLAAAVFARDALLPLPRSRPLLELRLPGWGLGFAWPGQRAPKSAGPLDGSPSSLDDSALLTHVLLPGLRGRDITLPWLEPDVAPAPLRQAIGLTPSDGGWTDVLARVIDRYRFAPVIEAAGFTVPELLARACGAPPVVAAGAGADASPAAGLNAPAAREDAPAARAASPQHYTEIVAAIRAQGIHGHDAVVRELALLADARMRQDHGARVLLIGPPGTGKTALLAALARATGRPFLRFDASTVVDHGWAGLQLADIASMIYHAAGRDLARAEHAVVALDELCKCSMWPPLLGASGDGPSAGERQLATVRAGRQASLLALLDTSHGLITFSPEPNSAPLQMRTRHMLVVAAGAFRGLAMAGPTPTDHELQAYGLIDELTARLSHRVVMQPLTAPELERLWLTGGDAVAPARALAERLGFTLAVAPEAVRMVAHATAAGRGGLSPRTGAALIQGAARRLVLQALDDPARRDRDLLLGPDDVLPSLPPL